MNPGLTRVSSAFYRTDIYYMSKTRLASSVILTRGNRDSPEVFLVQRSPHLRFMGGYFAFPGGTLLQEDYCAGNYPEDYAFLRCAVRELFEETGILAGGIYAENSLQDQIRKDLLQQPASLDSWMNLLNTRTLCFDELTYVCSITTPPLTSVKYMTKFMHMHLPAKSEPLIHPGELVGGDFFYPQDAINGWEKGDIEIAPPNLFLLRLMAENNFNTFRHLALEKTVQFARGCLHPVFFSPGIFMAPLKTPTLPPATMTNTYIVGSEILYIIDPGTPDELEQQRLFEKIDELINQGKKFVAILLTHHHIDHVGAVVAISQRYGLPVRAHELTYNLMPSGYLKGDRLTDMDKIDLGIAPDGTSGWHLKVIHTPGHAIDHLCYLESRYNSLIAGDMLSTISSILIDPPGGHMHTYIKSLERLARYPIRKLYPAHGSVDNNGTKLIHTYLEHRQQREKALVNSLLGEPQSLDQLLPKVYDDVPFEFRALASRSLLAGLIKLEEDNLCRKTDNKWQLP